MKTKQDLKKKTRNYLCCRTFLFYGLFVANKTANSPNKSCVLCKYTATVTYLEELPNITIIGIVN